VDDDAEWRERVALTLKRLGCTAVQAETVDEASLSAKSFRPAAVIMDVAMQGNEGWMLLRVLGADPLTKSIPVIVTTALPDVMDILAAGAQAVLSKPVPDDELAGALKRVGACTHRFVVAVDEDPKALDMYERMLSPQGYHVVRCSSAKRMEAAVENTEPDLVLVNWMTLLASGREIERTDLPVVGVAPHPLSPRVRAELRQKLTISLIPGDGTRPSFRANLGAALRAATPTERPPSRRGADGLPRDTLPPSRA
jgi:DNA-binding response OmpR family regulator